MPGNSIDYYNSVVEKTGGLGKTTNSIRLFMVPGMGHCRGGPGVDAFDTLSALEQWREKDKAPPEIMAKNRETGMARPLCPYPQAAEYKGSGDLKDAANWRCAVPK